MAGLKHIASPLGRFVGGACALVGGASAGTAASAAVTGTGVALTGPAAIGILAVLAAFAGGAAIYKGVTARNADGTSDEILQRLTKLTHEHRSLSRALALLPGDIPACPEQIAQRIRTLGAVFADDDPQNVAGRLAGEPELAGFLKAETQAREASDEQFRLALDNLLNEAIEQRRFRPGVVAALNGLDAKLDAVLDGQDRVEAKIDSIADYLIAQNQSLHAENRELAVDNEGLRTQLRAAVERVADAETAAGRDPMARLEELRQGDAHDLLAFLDEQIDKDELDLIEKHRERAAVAFLVGQIGKAEASLHKILSMDSHNIDALNRMGHVHQIRGEFDDAEAAYRRVLGLAGDRTEIKAIACGNLGMVLLSRGKLDAAKAACLEGLALDASAERMDKISGHLGNLAVVVEDMGDLEQAEQLQRKALSMARRHCDPSVVAIHAGNLGLVLRRRGELDTAEDLVRESLDIASELKHPEGIANGHSALGLVFYDLGQFDKARESHLVALRIDNKLGRKEGVATHNANLGSIADREGNAAEARHLWTVARDQFAEIGAEAQVQKLQGWLDHLPPP